jgi:peptide/nickel transport system permease protein
MSGRRSFRAGCAVCAAGVAIALLAPLLANEKPLLVRIEGSLCAPALGGVFGCPAGEGIDWTRAAPGAGIRVLLRAPVTRSPTTPDLASSYLPPSRAHPLGTDSLGRDVAARLVHGTRVAVIVGGLATLLALLAGLAVGGAAGAVGGAIDLILSRGIDLVACFPTLILSLVLAAAAERPGMVSLVAAIAATRWTGIARYFRAEILRQKELGYWEAARAAGARAPRILLRHALPNAIAPILVTAAFSVSSAVILEAGMSFLGLGLPPPSPSWGSILGEAQRQVRPGWWLVLFPSLALFATVLGCTLVAEGTRDATDPRIARM